MVESRKRPLGRSSEQMPSLTEILEKADLNADQKKAKEDLSGLDLPPDIADAGALLFFCLLWQESGSLNPIKKITGMKNDKDIRSLIEIVGESDKLTSQYAIYYTKYKTPSAPQV